MRKGKGTLTYHQLETELKRITFEYNKLKNDYKSLKAAHNKLLKRLEAMNDD